MEPEENLFGDDSPKPQKKNNPKQGFAGGGAANQIPQGTKDNKTGSSRRNRKRVIETKIGSLSEAPPSLVANNHKLKYKSEGATVEEETDVVSLVAMVFKNTDGFPQASAISEENDDGDTEYKLKLVDTSRERIQQLTTQMKFRIKEGQGEAFYNIGYEDNGNPLGLNLDDLRQSLNSICHIANELRVELVVQRILRAQQGMVAEVSVREVRESVKFGIKLSLLGHSGSGKSSMVCSLAWGAPLGTGGRRQGTRPAQGPEPQARDADGHHIFPDQLRSITSSYPSTPRATF